MWCNIVLVALKVPLNPSQPTNQPIYSSLLMQSFEIVENSNFECTGNLWTSCLVQILRSVHNGPSEQMHDINFIDIITHYVLCS